MGRKIKKQPADEQSKKHTTTSNMIIKGTGTFFIGSALYQADQTYEKGKRIERTYKTLEDKIGPSHYKQIKRDRDLEKVFESTIENQQNFLDDGELSYLDSQLEQANIKHDENYREKIMKKIDESQDSLTTLNTVSGFTFSVGLLALGVWTLYQSE